MHSRVGRARSAHPDRLLLVLGVGVVWAARRHEAAGRREHARLEAAQRAHVQELRESRARLAQVAHAERRGIERDLHDGCQQRLIGLRIKLALAEELVAAENEAAVKLIHEMGTDAEAALEDLHALVHGIYPAVLLDHGLAAALKAIGRSSPMPVRVLAEGSSRRYPADVEAAVYFACAEALQNIAKHAGSAATVRVTLRHGTSGLSFDVSDDGHGFGDDISAGNGLTNMEDRVNAIGGRLRVTSALGRGTTVQGWIGGAT